MIHDFRKNKKIRLRNLSDPDLDWLPDSCKKKQQVNFAPCSGEQNIYRHRIRPLVSQWAIKNRPITDGASKATGIYDPDAYPYQAGILDTMDLSYIREVGICKVTQSAGSTSVETYLMFRAEFDPVNVGIYYQDQLNCQRRMVSQIGAAFKHKKLKHLTTGLDDHINLKSITLKSMSINAGWGSVGTASSFSYGIVFIDEANKLKLKIDKTEASLYKLIRDRKKDFAEFSKVFVLSSPTVPTGLITEFMDTADAVFDFFPKCPECGKYEHFEHDQVKFTEERQPHKMERSPSSAWYECGWCGDKWDDRRRHKALIKGDWFARDLDWLEKSQKKEKYGHDPRPRQQYLEAERPPVVCFHQPSLIVPKLPLCQYVADFLRGLKDAFAMHYFYNHHLAIAFQYYGKSRHAEQLKSRQDHRRNNLLPGGNQVAALVGGIDTQGDRFYYWIQAFGWTVDLDGQPIDQTSWQVASREVLSVRDMLAGVLDTVFFDEDGVEYMVNLAMIDSGGNRTYEIYSLCNTHPGVLVPYKGQPRRSYLWKPTKYEYIFNGRRYEAAGDLYLFNKQALYEVVNGQLSVSPDAQDGGIWFNKDLTAEEIEHICAPKFDKATNNWTTPDNVRDDYCDCLVMCHGAAIILEATRNLFSQR